MTLKRRQFTREFKFQVVREVEAGKPRAQVAREDHVHPTVIRRWQQEHQRQAERFIKPLQYEASDGCEYSNLPEAHALRAGH